MLLTEPSFLFTFVCKLFDNELPFKVNSANGQTDSKVLSLSSTRLLNWLRLCNERNRPWEAGAVIICEVFDASHDI